MNYYYKLLKKTSKDSIKLVLLIIVLSLTLVDPHVWLPFQDQLPSWILEQPLFITVVIPLILMFSAVFGSVLLYNELK